MTRWMVRIAILVACGLWIGAASMRAHAQRAQAQTGDAQILLGRQLVISHACGDCHGGFQDPADPAWLQGVKVPEQQEFKIGPFTQRPRNLTPDDETGTGKYTERQIFNALRYGLRPAKTPDVEITSSTPGQGNFPAAPNYLSPGMPWAAWKYMTDAELKAIAAYLKRGLKPAANKVADSEGPPDFWAGEYKKAQYGSVPPVKYPAKAEK
jgi:mono/diheme cytochrome c family protein